MTTGENIARIRRERGIRQVDFARRLRVTQTAVSKWETGSRSPSRKNLAKIAKALQVTEEELVA